MVSGREAVWKTDWPLGLHLLQSFDSQDLQALFQDAPGQVAKDQAAGALFGFRFEDRAVLVETGKVAGQFVEIIAEKIRPIVLSHSFQHRAEVQQVFGKGDLLWRSELDGGG